MSGTVATAEDFGKVAVLLGGRSAEREISLKSGAAVLAALQARGVNAQPLDSADEDFFGKLQGGAFDRAFIALHGRGGECGAMQGLLETFDLPFTGSGVLGSALAMDKLRSKQVWQGMALSTPPFTLLRSETDLAAVDGATGFPLMLKPVHEGSSIGMTKVDQASQLLSAWRDASRYDEEVLAERWITGNEYTAAIVAGTCLPLIRLETPHEFYDYAAKYQADSTRYHCPCGLPANTEAGLQALALDAFNAVGAAGWGRVDFMLDKTGQPWLIEVNTVPGMTDHSLVPMAAAVHGWDMPELVWRILETSMGGRQ